MLPNYITDKIITLYPTDEIRQRKEFQQYKNCVENKYYNNKAKTIENVSPCIAYMICKHFRYDYEIEHIWHMTDKYEQLYGDLETYLINDKYGCTNHIEVKSGVTNNLRLYCDGVFYSLDCNSIYIQNKSSCTELGNIFHQVANTMLVYCESYDLWIYIDNIISLFIYFRKMIYSNFKDMSNGSWLIGNELKNKIELANERLRSRFQFYDYYLQADDNTKYTLSIRLFLDSLADDNLLKYTNEKIDYELNSDTEHFMYPMNIHFFKIK